MLAHHTIGGSEEEDQTQAVCNLAGRRWGREILHTCNSRRKKEEEERMEEEGKEEKSSSSRRGGRRKRKEGRKE